MLSRHQLMHVKKNRETTNSREIHELKVINVDRLTELLNQIGFRTKLINSYGDFELPPGRAAVLCRI